MIKQTDQKEDKTKKKGFSAVTDAFVEHNGFLKSFLKRFMNSPQDIEDIAQEAYMRAFKVESGKTEVSHPKTLLFTIAKNIALNELKSKSRRITDYIEECQLEHNDEGESVEGQLEALDGLEAYCAAVDTLPEQCKRVYLLRKVHGLPHKEIAARLNITVRSVERHLQKGAIKCRAYLREHDLEVSGKERPTKTDIESLHK